MDNEFLLALKCISPQALVVGFIAFILTMIIKLPIKKLTAKLLDDKRKLVNSLIMFIPAVLSLILAILYYGIFLKSWFCEKAFEVSASGWVLSLTIYAIYGRLAIVVKGIFSGKLKIDQSLTKDTVNFIKQNIKNASAIIKANQKELANIEKKTKVLVDIKCVLESNEKLLDLTKLSEANIELEKLEAQESCLNSEIKSAQQKINDLNAMLYLKEGK